MSLWRKLLLLLTFFSGALVLVQAHADSTKEKLETIQKKIDTQCHNYKDVLRKGMASAPFAKDKKYMDTLVDLRNYTDCECLPKKLVNKKLVELEPTKLMSRIDEISDECTGSGMKKYWIAMCDSLVKNEIKDAANRGKACSCIDPLLQKIEDSKVRGLFNALGKKDPKYQAFDACVEKYK